MALASAWGANANLTASLVTCWPGPEVYELCGHEAVRIHGREADGTPVDSVWNYGVFDFAAPNFLYRFVKGETDYMLVGYPFAWFMADYHMRGSRVVEQRLNLRPDQVDSLRLLLQREALPQNRTYRYNYIKDNCATRIVDRLSQMAGDSIVYTAPATFGSYRQAMRHYHRNYPWYQFGIDLVLGSGLDGRYEAGDEMFLPLEMRRMMARARWVDGSPLVSGEQVLLTGADDATLPPTPWYLTPMAMSVSVLLISAGVAIYAWRTGKRPKWWYTIYYSAVGLTGCVVAFLYFFSTHEATSPNLMILWINPLQLTIPAMIWSRRTRPAVLAMMWLNLAVMILLLAAWPFQAQSANAAMFPLMAADILLAAAYAATANRQQTIIAEKKSYNERGTAPRTGNGTVRKPATRQAGAARKTTSRRK